MKAASKTTSATTAPTTTPRKARLATVAGTEPTASMASTYRPIGVGIASAMHGLFERSLDRLSSGDLDQLAGLSSEAAATMSRLSQLCVALGCFISSDAAEASVGNYSSREDVPDLLRFIGDVADQASALVRISGDAAYMRGAAAGNVAARPSVREGGAPA